MAIIFVFLPILYAVIERLKYTPVWFSTLIAMNFQLSYLSPLVTMTAHSFKAVVPQR